MQKGRERKRRGREGEIKKTKERREKNIRRIEHSR